MKRTFRTAPLVYKAEPTLNNFSTLLESAGLLGQLDFGPPFETSPSINEVVERFTHLENMLLQMQRSLDKVNYKFNLLLQHFNGPTLTGELGRPGTSCVGARSGPRDCWLTLTPITSSRAIPPHGSQRRGRIVTERILVF